MPTFLLAFGALFSIVNPLSGAFIFFGATQGMEPKTRAAGWLEARLSTQPGAPDGFRQDSRAILELPPRGA